MIFEPTRSLDMTLEEGILSDVGPVLPFNVSVIVFLIGAKASVGNRPVSAGKILEEVPVNKF